MGGAGFLGGLRNWGYTHLTCKLSICWEARIWGPTLTGEPLCPRSQGYRARFFQPDRAHLKSGQLILERDFRLEGNVPANSEWS